MAGCFTLAKSVIMAIPIYVMQTAALLYFLYDKIDRLVRDFI